VAVGGPVGPRDRWLCSALLSFSFVFLIINLIRRDVTSQKFARARAMSKKWGTKGCQQASSVKISSLLNNLIQRTRTNVNDTISANHTGGEQ
jgi:hypothetical protein